VLAAELNKGEAMGKQEREALELIVFGAEEPWKNATVDGIPDYRHMIEALIGIKQIAREALREEKP